MTLQIESLGSDTNSMKLVSDIFFNYFRDTIYSPGNASLDIEKLPEEFQDLGKGLIFFTEMVSGASELAKEFAKELSKDEHQQRVKFMGNFSSSFNNMIKLLEQRQKINVDKKSKLQLYAELMLENCLDPVLLFYSNGELLYASESYLQYCQITEPEKIYGKKLDALFLSSIAPESISLLENLFRAAIAENRTLKLEQTLDFSLSGVLRHFQVQIAPMLDMADDFECVIVILHDATEIVNAHREAERAREIAEQSSKAKSDFLANMSHEIRTPMNAIIGMAAIYDATDDLSRKDYCIDKIQEASSHLLGVINDILDMSKIEMDKFELFQRKFSLRHMIDRISEFLMFKIDERRQHLSFSIDPNLPESIVTDEQRLSQVITNLLSNAAKFTPEEGDISLSAELKSDNGQYCVIRFAIKDNGIGIADEHQKKLFMPFVQVDGGISRKFGGIGLGLAISKHIVEMMNGNIWLESEAGKGASFIFEIQVGKISEAENESLNHNTGSQSNGSADGIFFGHRALLAEDVEVNREILIALLEHTGIFIDTAVDGINALEKFVSAPDSYDLILMDINMPNMDGYEATKLIRGSGLPGADTLPIIALTANVFHEDVEKCLRSGMNEHLGKPIDADKIISVLQKYLFPISV